MAPPSVKVLFRDSPSRSIALATDTHILILKNSSTSSNTSSRNASLTNLHAVNNSTNPQCIAEFGPKPQFDLKDYRSNNFKSAHGTLGLITVNNDIFLCVITSTSKAAEVRPGEVIYKINTVDFHCLSSSKYDYLLVNQVNAWPTDDIDETGQDLANPNSEQAEHPCLALKKLLSSGTFFYSTDFDVTQQLSKRLSDHEPTIAIDSFDSGFLWNSYMIQPLVDFRSKLSPQERITLDESGILTSAIRGFCATAVVPWSSAPLRFGTSGLASSMTIISRLSCRRAGTRFLARGIDDAGNVANFVQTETIFWNPSGICFSYIQVRGSIPIFWEQAAGLLPAQQKVSITRSIEATEPAFEKHFETLLNSYGSIHVVNLLSKDKPVEIELSTRYRQHLTLFKSSLEKKNPLAEIETAKVDPDLVEERHFEDDSIKLTEYDLHYHGIDQPRIFERELGDSPYLYAYFESEDHEETKRDKVIVRRTIPLRTQEGVFRVNCLDCLDRTNVVQGWLSRTALRAFLTERNEDVSADFWARHSTLWADNGDTLSRIYAGTGAINTSYTRHGKKSLGMMLSNVRKSATRLYVNNFADKGRQNTIDILLGRLVGQAPVRLYDPIGESVQSELHKRAGEFTSTKKINILVGTMNLNGKTAGLSQDLTSWLCPNSGTPQSNPEIIAVGFQEIVELSPQQIMSTDPHRRQEWERIVRNTLNEHAERNGEEEYIILQGGQLVGASLTLFVRASALEYIRNVEGSIKKTGLSGMAGNKGAVAIRLDCANTSICFVTAHLAAGQHNWEERNRDFKTITQGLRFAGNRSIDDNDCIVWCGDFNYRIDLNNEDVRRYTKHHDIDTLYTCDQLNLQMRKGQVFPFYNEGRIKFLPTYKFNVGTDEYDTSEKYRTPAWTDRILHKGNILHQTNYDSAPLKFSDHRPVYATFSCTISVINEEYRNKLSSELYATRRRRNSSVAPNRLADEDSEGEYVSLNLPDSARPLPPPSSRGSKWWLDNGLPARSPLAANNTNQEPLPDRAPNPFGTYDTSENKPEPEAEWVTVEKGNTVAPPVPPPRRSAAAPASSAPSLPVRAAKAFAEYALEEKETQSPEQPPLRGMSYQSKMEAEYRQMKTQEHRASISRQGRGEDLPSRASVPPPPPPRNLIRKPMPPPRPQKPKALTSRRASVQSMATGTSLLDEVDDGMEGLKDWELLKPMA
jgi:inositol-1,4,5-trisphosphate 5-phosphatase